MDRSLKRAERLKMLEAMLYRSTRGLKVAELAERLGVYRSTVYRDLQSLEASGAPVWRDGTRFGLLKEGYLATVRVNLHEAMALYLSARLLSAYGDKHNPHAVSALEKLAQAMPEPIGEHIARTARVAASRRKQATYLEVLEALAQAWAERRRVRLVYHSPRSGEITERDFDTYFIEPSSIGYTCYAIGHDHLRGEIRTFKVERIEKIELLDTHFEARGGFDPYSYLAHAWGVMGGDELVEVKLRFSPEVTYRVRESDWPGVVRVEDEAGGGCAMVLRVSHVIEMKPWIRGWGADCEVLEPAKLREEIAAEMKRAAERYCS